MAGCLDLWLRLRNTQRDALLSRGRGILGKAHRFEKTFSIICVPHILPLVSFLGPPDLWLLTCIVGISIV